MVRSTFMQVPAEQWYPDKIQPSPEGRKDADTGDTGDTEAIVVDPAGGGVATDTHTVARNTKNAKKRPAEDRSNLVRNMSMALVSQGECVCEGRYEHTSRTWPAKGSGLAEQAPCWC